jgi:hypothetical protein
MADLENKVKIDHFRSLAKQAKFRIREKMQQIIGGVPESRRPFVSSLFVVVRETPKVFTPARGHQPRYRLQTGTEKKAEEKVKKTKAELEELKHAITVLSGEFKDDAELMVLVAELKALQETEAQITTDLEAHLQKEQVARSLETVSRGVDSDGVAELAKSAADKIRAHQSAELKKKDATRAADADFKATLSETIKMDRALAHFVSDVMLSGSWMIDPTQDRGARELMKDIEEAQQKGSRPEIRTTTNLICYSKNQGRIVFCKKINGKWDFHYYYTPCSFGVAFSYFSQCQGHSIDALPKSDQPSEYTTTRV